MLINPRLAKAVNESLEIDPRIPDSAEIAVSAYGGLVTLRGTVESFSQRRAATDDAKKIVGAYEVDDQLKVNLIGANRREDDEIRGVALQALMWDTDVPSDTIDVNVATGWITLEGNVAYQFQSDAAYDDVASLSGVAGVTNKIRINEL
jgi:osmotically-inducible protein OsmY